MRTNRDRKITSGFEEVDKLLDEAEATGDLAALGKAERLLNALAVAVLDDSKDDEGEK